MNLFRRRNTSTSNSVGQSTSSSSAGPSTSTVAGSSGSAGPSTSTAPGSSGSAGPSSPITASRHSHRSSSTSAGAGSSTSTTGKGKVKALFTSLVKKKNQPTSDQLLLDAQTAKISLNINERWTIFTFKKLQDATDNFNQDRIISQDAFGPIYRGFLGSKKEEVAVKRLDRSGGHGIAEFVNEMRILDMIDHPHFIKLVGYCAEDCERLLVYQPVTLGSLNHYLFGRKPGSQPLNWVARRTIIQGLIWALENLHNIMDPAIIYGNMNSSNVMFDWRGDIKLCGFGLAILASSGDGFMKATAKGSKAYCAPEHMGLDHLTSKSDIYSFGIILLEMVTGRKAYDVRRHRSQQMLVDWAKPLLRERKFVQMVDPLLKGVFRREEVQVVLEIAERCIHDLPKQRPTISDVIMHVKYFINFGSPEVDNVTNFG